jgi:glutamyl-tRNA reductase
MALITLGVNHTTAPVDLREQVAFDSVRLPDALAQLLEQFPGVREVVILSTCNRTELFLAVDGEVETEVMAWLASYHGLLTNELEPHIYMFEQLRAVQHMMRVAAGLDSLILGEPQILGQFKEAIRLSRKAHAMGPELEQALGKVLSVAKRIRTETAIGRNSVSVAYAAVTLAGRIFSDLSACKVVLIGAGETIRLVAEYLCGHHVRNIDVVNRTLENAETLATEIGGSAWPLGALANRILQADIVISSTGSAIPILGKGLVESAQKCRRHKPMFIVDLAVPRDVETQVGDLDSVYLYTVDDLNAVVEEGLEQRQEAACHAEELISEEVANWTRHIRGHRAVETIRALREIHLDISEKELFRALKSLESGKPAVEVMSQLSRNLTNKFLHMPTVVLRSAAEQGDLLLIESAVRLFAVNNAEESD